MASYVKRALIAEDALRRLADKAEKCVGRVVAHSTLLEAAMAVIMKHDLLDEFVNEHSRLLIDRSPPNSEDAGK